MSENCENKLAQGFLQLCGYKPKAGIDNKYFINFDDVDKEATQLSADRTKITTLVLKENAKIYPAEGDKQSKGSHEFKEDVYGNGYTHTDEYIIKYRGDVAKQNVQKLVDGGKVLTIYKKTDTGLNGEITYEVAGFDSGMKLKKDSLALTENAGTQSISVATEEGAEGTGLKTLFMTSLAATESFIQTHLWTPTP